MASAPDARGSETSKQLHCACTNNCNVPLLFLELLSFEQILVNECEENALGHLAKLKAAVASQVSGSC